jgi:two-component system, OmpR family, sensor histidine kinase KdpD
LAIWGGVAVGLVASLVAFGLENYYFVRPLHTLQVSRPDDAVALVAFLVFATVASGLVNRFARRSREADRARAEAQVLAKAAVAVGTSHEDLLPLLDSLRAVFDATSVSLLERVAGEWRPEVVSGQPSDDDASVARFPIDDDHALMLGGVALDGEDRQLVSAFAERIAAGLRVLGHVADAAQLQALANAEATRSGLLHVARRNRHGTRARAARTTRVGGT